RGERQRKDHQAIPRRDRSVRPVPAPSRTARTRWPAAGAAVASKGMAARGPPPLQGQRSVRGEERRYAKVPHPRLALVLAPWTDDAGPGVLRQREWCRVRLAVLLT